MTSRMHNAISGGIHTGAISPNTGVGSLFMNDSIAVPGRVCSAGVDIVDLARFERGLRRSGPAFVHRVFDRSECAAVGVIDDCADDADDGVLDSTRVAALARIFGIKESVVKVAGGLPTGARYRDVVVGSTGTELTRMDAIARSASVQLRGELARWAERFGVTVTGGVRAFGDVEVCWAAAVPVDPTGSPRSVDLRRSRLIQHFYAEKVLTTRPTTQPPAAEVTR
jgi:holo-[acyl-carrier protein] synthase